MYRFARSATAALLAATVFWACSDQTATAPPSAPAAEYGLARFGDVDPVGDVIATGLNNPRHLALGPRGSLFVTEAGLGAGNETDGAQAGLGATGSVTRIDRPASANPSQARVLTGLASAALPEEGDLHTIGADGISFGDGGAKAPMYLSFGGAGAPGLGLLVRYSPPDWTATTVADVGGYDYQWTADHADLWVEFPDANPYGTLASEGHLYVVDAAANTLDEVMPNGDVHVLAYFPNPADAGGISDAVPTCVARGPDGALYIGTLALAELFVLGPGRALVYRVDPAATVPDDLDTILSVATVWADGFDTISDCTFGPNGDFYATEMFAGASNTGRVVRVPFRHPDAKTRFGEGQVVLPTGIAVGEGAVYVSSFGTAVEPGAGQVLRFRSAR